MKIDLCSHFAPMTQDTLSDLLRGVRLQGALFFHVNCTAPWVTGAPEARRMAPIVMPHAEHLMEYHVVLEGNCWVGALGDPPVQLQAGDVVLFPQGDAHILSSTAGMQASPDIDFLREWRPPQLPFMLREGEKGRSQDADVSDNVTTSLLCGFLGCDRGPFNPLLSALPKMILASSFEHGNGNDGHGDENLISIAHIAMEESRKKQPGGEVMLERLSELMFVNLIRHYIRRLPPDQSGWLAGLRDRYVGRALAFIHESPEKPWSLDVLASNVGLSRSALHERFILILGMPPIHYLTSWRMQLASRRLLDGNSRVLSIAIDSGYESEAAFSRAFKRHVGKSPAAWRRQKMGAPEGV